MRGIVLIGFMGTGKTTVGRLLAERLGLPFEDVDDTIERVTARTINQIFQESGEAYFRERETHALKELLEKRGGGAVVSTGGGAVLREENWRLLRKLGGIVALMASPETIHERVKHLTHRPLLNVPNPFDEIVRLLRERSPYYRRADAVVETDGLAPAAVAAEVAHRLGLPWVP